MAELLIFGAKFLIAIIMILLLLIGILAIIMRGREKMTGRFQLKHLNKKFEEIKDHLQAELLPAKEYKAFHKAEKNAEKERSKSKEASERKRIFLINFHGDIKASGICALREEVTAILSVAKPTDEVVVKLESGGGMVHAYGLATSQLQRFRNCNIPLTVIIDKIAASGGYMMACVANRIVAAPFALIGSIGVLVQLPNFHRLLQDKHIDFEQLTAGNYKRTLTLFGENTEQGREKMREELEAIHQLFKNLIRSYRQNIDIDKVATGEHWTGTEALSLHLVDHLQTSDDWLFQHAATADIYEIHYHTKKTLSEKIFASAQSFKSALFGI
ncbi:MAG: protease SohB [Gammaproteobacteria bacterium]|nr:protease SohB [Gammaproteobacteria bacterium]